MQAALASAAAFSVGAALPLLVMLLAPSSLLTVVLATTSLAFLATLGWLAARIGGARTMRAALRVTFWGALAMALTYAAGALFGAVV